VILQVDGEHGESFGARQGAVAINRVNSLLQFHGLSGLSVCMRLYVCNVFLVLVLSHYEPDGED